MTGIRTIAEADFEPFGRIYPIAGKSRAEIESRMMEIANQYQAPLELVRTSREAGAAIAIAEVHPKSPQLTVAFDGDWLVRVVPRGIGPEGFPHELRVFRVPAGLPVMIDAGIWHAPTQVLAPTEVLTIFRDGTTKDGTEWVELKSPLYSGVAF